MGMWIRGPRLRGRVGPVRASVGLTGVSLSACCVGCSPCLMIVCAVAVVLVVLALPDGGRRR